MDPKETPSVHKYFELADRFVRIRLVDPRRLPVEPGPELDGAAYRRSVVGACVEGFEQGTPQAFARLAPEDPDAAWDELYQLVVSVNPMLDIRTVGLRTLADEQTTASNERTDEGRRRLRRRVRRLESRLARRIIGQDGAIEVVARVARRAAAGLADDARARASMLFVGRTGTGKTELASAFADELGPLPLVRVDCSEFAEGHEYGKLIGAPPGYVGHEQGGVLTDALRRTPDCVLLFDEVEKAHARLHHLLLQLLDAGRLTDGSGRTVDASRAFVVLTSNAGARELADASRPAGFPRAALDEDAAGAITARALSDVFSPEFLGRLDEVVQFRELDPGDARAIAQRRLVELGTRVRRRGLRVKFSPAVARWVAERGFAPASGAREIARIVRKHLEAPLAERLLDGARGDWVHVSIRRGAPRFEAA